MYTIGGWNIEYLKSIHRIKERVQKQADIDETHQAGRRTQNALY